MSRIVTVDVTAYDIVHGEATVCFSCPIALALRRTALWPDVDPRDFSATPYHLRIGPMKAPTPKVALAFMTAFDNGQPVAPFTFTIELS